LSALQAVGLVALPLTAHAIVGERHAAPGAVLPTGAGWR